ncbi:hypothetical protein ACFVOO_24090 [Streptomyces rochei]|uniref:hypothetical protein n=1 Tax=Streptomyces rochei TaxID=1928 RepID=UPI0036C8FB49
MSAVPESAARLSPEREAEIAARAEAASPGPWLVELEQCDCQDGLCSHGVYVTSVYTGDERRDDLADFPHEDWQFAIHARTDVPALLAELAAVRAERDEAQACVAELEAERHTTNEALSDAAEQFRRDRDRIAELEADLGEAAVTSEALNRALHNEKLAGSALYAALTMPTTPEQRQAALDKFKAVAHREEPAR